MRTFLRAFSFLLFCGIAGAVQADTRVSGSIILSYLDYDAECIASGTACAPAEGEEDTNASCPARSIRLEGDTWNVTFGGFDDTIIYGTNAGLHEAHPTETFVSATLRSVQVCGDASNALPPPTIRR